MPGSSKGVPLVLSAPQGTTALKVELAQGHSPLRFIIRPCAEIGQSKWPQTYTHYYGKDALESLVSFLLKLGRDPLSPLEIRENIGSARTMRFTARPDGAMEIYCNYAVGIYWDSVELDSAAVRRLRDYLVQPPRPATPPRPVFGL